MDTSEKCSKLSAHAQCQHAVQKDEAHISGRHDAAYAYQTKLLTRLITGTEAVHLPRSTCL